MTIKILKLKYPHLDAVVQLLIDEIPPDTWDEIESSIKASKDMWNIEMHFGYGMYLRNIIYESGIPAPWYGLDWCWDIFLEMALKKRRIAMRDASV